MNLPPTAAVHAVATGHRALVTKKHGRFVSFRLAVVIAVAFAEAQELPRTARFHPFVVRQRAITAPLPHVGNMALPQWNSRQPLVMEVRIGPTGNVETSLILDSPNEIFAKAAGAAVLSWKFRPFLVGGAPIVVITKLTFYFRPNGSGGVTVIDANQPEPDRVRKSRG